VIDTTQLIPREQPSDQQKIRYWRDHLRERGGMPIEIMPCGKASNGKARYLICNGHHRLAAARAEGALSVLAKVITR
jgi:hypothetical protein